jgi:hypothetical protein
MNKAWACALRCTKSVGAEAKFGWWSSETDTLLMPTTRRYLASEGSSEKAEILCSLFPFF